MPSGGPKVFAVPKASAIMLVPFPPRRAVRPAGCGVRGDAGLMLTSSADDQHLVQAIKAGALSYLPKTAGVDQVIEAVRAAARGESVLQPAATARLLRELRHASADPLGQLTPRETDVLKGLAQGRSNREIARALSVSEETVKSHVSSILAKLGLADRTQAATFALQHHLVPLDLALGP